MRANHFAIPFIRRVLDTFCEKVSDSCYDFSGTLDEFAQKWKGDFTYKYDQKTVEVSSETH